MTIAILYLTLCVSAYYLVARASITEWLWSRYPSWLDYWTMCAACSGLWYGLGCGFLGAHYDLPLFGLDPDHWLTIVAAGALGMVWTPVIAFAQVYSWERLLAGEEPEDEPELRVAEMEEHALVLPLQRPPTEGSDCTPTKPTRPI